MTQLLQVDFNYVGPFGEEMSKMLLELAETINQEPGFIWKIWTENQTDKIGGGIYLFETKETAQAYLEKHTARLGQMGISPVRGIIFDVNMPLSKVNHGPIG